MSFDVGLDSNGDLPVVTQHITGIDLIAQSMSIALKLHRGEWLLDERVGLPFLEWIQIKPPPFDTITAEVRRTMEGIDGVTAVENLVRVFDRDTQELTFTADIITEEGRISATVSPFGTAGNRNPAITLYLYGSQ